MQLRLAGTLVAIALLAAPAGAAEVKVLATGSQTDVFKELIPSFEQATGHKVTADYAGLCEQTRGANENT